MARQFRRKSPKLEAFQLTAARNSWPVWLKDAAEQNRVTPFPGPVGEGGVVNVSGREGRNARASIGDWIVLADDGALEVHTHSAFAEQFEGAAS